MFVELVREELFEEKDAGNQVRFNCPFCSDSAQHFYVSKTTGLWFCQKEQRGGNPVQFVMELFGMSFAESLEILETYGYYVDKSTGQEYRWVNNELSSDELLYLQLASAGKPKEVEEEVQEDLSCPPFPTNTRLLMKDFDNPDIAPYFAYLHSRGVKLEQIKKYGICYCDYGLTKKVNGEEFSIFHHLIFPTTYNGKIIYWNTRSIDRDPFIKSINAPALDGCYSSKNAVFNLDRAKKTGKIVITEGVFDALTVGDSGVCTYGKGITREQIQMIGETGQAHNCSVYLFLDNDAWSYMIGYAEKLQQYIEPEDTYFVINSSNEDANDLGEEICAELMEDAVRADASGKLKLKLILTR